MRIIEVLNSEKCKKLFEEVEEFVRISLSEYNDQLEENGFDYSDKDIFDFVWGTINFSKAEICVLDSPLLQRLRRIHHLGLADIVYCNANSSRFSHTIGVTEVAGRMAQVISKKVNEIDDTYNFDEIVRMAAILHDTGHMFYSHVSEIYFSHDESFPRYREITDARTFFCEQTSSQVALHEMLSVMIVHSKEMIRLIKNIAPYFSKTRITTEEHFRQFAEYISCLIIGTPIDKKILPYSAIINSSVDADKLDYLSRDSESTKVPIAVDIARLIQKIEIVNIKEMEYPNIWSGPRRGDETLKIMAIRNSAKKAFWQLSNARSSLYESVYYHQKVLTAESMFRKALSCMFRNVPKEDVSFTDILKWTDDIFNEYWDRIIYVDKLNDDDRKEASNILKCVRERNLYKRVAAFSRDNLHGSLANVKKFIKNVIQNPRSSEYEAFVNKLCTEYGTIRNFLEGDSCDSKPCFMFAYAKYEAMASMPIENGNGRYVWSSALMKQETMEAGRKSKQEQFYLLTDCKDRVYVYLALEKTLLNFGITQLAPDAIICSKVGDEEIIRKKNALFEKEYYKDSLTLIQGDTFEQLIDKTIYQGVLQKYRSFQGANGCVIDDNRLKSFLCQFLWLELTKKELHLLIDGVLRLLNSAYYIDRDSFQGQAGKLIESRISKQEDTMHIIMLGGQYDSAQHLTYYFNDIQHKNKISIDGSLSAALSNCGENNSLYFFDDGAYSGRQVVSIFQEFMGVPKDDRATNEHHVDELNNIEKEKLKKTKIVLLYLCFNEKSKEYITLELQKLGILNVDIWYNMNMSKKVFDTPREVFKNEEQRLLVKKYLKEIGETIIESEKMDSNGEYKERWDKKRIKDAALGYNDAQQMVVFSTNVPTYTISAFWFDGKYYGNEWKGLFSRTKKE